MGFSGVCLLKEQYFAGCRRDAPCQFAMLLDFIILRIASTSNLDDLD